MSLHSSSSVNGDGSTPKDPLYKILEKKCLEGSNKMKEEENKLQICKCKSKKDSEREDKNFKVTVATNQTSTPFKDEIDYSVIGGS